MAEEQKATGFILIDKPVGPTSFGVIARLRRITGIKKIGHAGTLDPFASGLLILAVGREATREISRFVKLDKEYIAEARLGASTNTYDREGKIIGEYAGERIKKSAIKEALKNFKGEIAQTPPMFSAKKIGGKKLYELARQGIEVERRPNQVKVYEINILKYRWPDLRLRIKCSSGTYIRSLAYDLGQSLGCGAYLEGLRRTAIGRYKVGRAATLAKVTEKNWSKKLFTA